MQLSVLQALRKARAAFSTKAELRIHGLHMTHDVMDALRSLPTWGRTLDLTDCTWPLEPSEYKRLAQCIPAKYRKWRLGAVSEALVDSVWDAVLAEGPKGRKGLSIVWAGPERSMMALE